MLEATFSHVVLYFAMYSFVGWLCEEIYCSLPAKKWVNRGFLYGPYCPVYGFGALIILFLLLPLKTRPVLLYLSAIAATTVLEYITSWLMEKIFGLRWWDYSNQKFNLNGRICLLNSLLFGVMGLALVYIIHPLFSDLVNLFPENIVRLLSSVFILAFFADFLVTLNNLASLKAYLVKLKASLEGLQQQARDTAAASRRTLESLQRQLRDAATLSRYSRLLDAFPTLTHKDYAATLENLRGELERLRELGETKKKAAKERFQGWKQNQLRTSPAPEADKASVKNVDGEKSFALGANFYKLCWVFFIACILGFFVETLFCMATTGVIESRQGMIYGPFNQVYGFGAVLMVLALSPLSKYKDNWIFLGSMLIGGAFEWICSWLQEIIFSSSSWDYTGEHLSLGGRTSVLFMFFWGVLGLFFIRTVYPPLSRLIERIPNRQGHILTAIIAVVLCADMALSALAVYRWSERDKGVPPSNAAAEWLDERYPDEFMQTVYPNMSMKR